MQMNPLTMMQMFNQIKGSNNPMGMMQQMFGNDPLMQRAMQMGRGKNPQQLQETVRNLARQRGMDDQQLNQLLSQFGLRI